MSQCQPPATSFSNFQSIFNNALKAYQRRTKTDLLTHPLAAQLQECDSPSSILAMLQQQVQQLDQSHSSDERLTKWLDPTVNVLSALSDTIGDVVSLAFSPANLIFSGIGVILSTAKDVRAGQEALVEIFERVETFLRRLEIYCSVPPNEEMADTITTIMTEILRILGIATKEIKQGRMKKYLKKLIGKSEIEDALKRLDRLTQEEGRMATAQVLKVAHTVDERVRGVTDEVLGIDNRVARVDDRVADVDDRVASVGDGVKAVDDKVATVINDGEMARVVMQRTATAVDEVKRNQLRQDLRRWLSPTDPSANHNIACRAHHKGTATWFFQGSLYNEWKSTPSLLWIHGKPGSGKSILCSTIIEDIQIMCNAGQASMAYFYFDFRDISKQHWRDLVPSLLTQLCELSVPHCDILSRYYYDHSQGARQPSDDTLTRCLKEMLTLPNQLPIYLIMDALDECSNISGIPSPRDQVLQLVKELVDLHVPNLHICVTSRPEVDIRDVLEPLTSHGVSLHDQTGQQKDIEDYVRSVVYSNSEPIMRRWKKEDKELVVETLSSQADGMFRWIFCQLETLRYCLPPSVRRTLRELPESLDETYERILKEIKRPNRGHARRVLQCLAVAIRPLHVVELAEVLAVDFDDAEGTPKLNADWRWEDQEQALLIACSSLIAIVGDGDSRVVQFSHFSVKEYLTSSRLATASGEASGNHIDLEPAHTTLAQACLCVLLQTQRDVDGHTPEDHPLTRYAAEHWTTHAQFEDVSSCLRKEMEYLFNQDKPHFEVWLKLYNIDIRPAFDSFKLSLAYQLSDIFAAGPLYYAALCGFHGLVENLIIKHPQDVNAVGGHHKQPLVAALAEGHFRTADLLRHHGADPHYRDDRNGRTILHFAGYYGNTEVARKLIEYGADVSDKDEDGGTPLYSASENSYLVDCSVHRLFLEHGVDVNAPAKDGSTPLHKASGHGERLEVVRLLLEGAADVNARENDGWNPLHCALYDGGKLEIVRLLLERGADINAQTISGSTPLHNALSYNKHLEVVHLLLERGADVNARALNGETPLYCASKFRGNPEVVRLLLEHDAAVNARAEDGSTPLHRASVIDGDLGVVRLLLERGADVNARALDGRTPLYCASSKYGGTPEVVRLLLEHGADANARAENGSTPLHKASGKEGNPEVVRLLLEHGADINVRTSNGSTPLHCALVSDEKLEVVRLVLERGVDVNARESIGSTPLQCVLYDDGNQAAVPWRPDDSWISSPIPTLYDEKLEVVRLLLERGVDVNARESIGWTPLHCALYDGGNQAAAPLLLERGADVNARTYDGWTPLLFASLCDGKLEVVRLLLERGADVNARASNGRTPLYCASKFRGNPEVVRLLLEHGADVNARAVDGLTPLHNASKYVGNPEVIRLLLERGADENAEDNHGRTASQLTKLLDHSHVVTAPPAPW